MRVAAILALIELLLASAASATPAHPQSILKAAARAMGRLGEGVIEARGQVEAEGLTGDHSEAVRLGDGAFMTRDRFALFSEAAGFDGRRHWKQDRSGGTHWLNAPFTVAETVTRSWLECRGYLRPGSASIEHVARETIDGRPATVLTMRPIGGNPVRLAFDDASHLLVQAQRDRTLSTTTESYSDYRRVDGFRAPFHIEIEDSGDRQVIRIDQYRRLSTAAGVSFSRPAPPHDTRISGPATIALDAPGFAVIPASINGHDYDFILDTGGHNIVTPEIAAELGLSAQGKGSSGGSGPGRVATSDTKIAELKLGSVTMTDQHFTVLDLGDAVKRKDKPSMAGILGLEVFERLVLTLDEPHGRLTIEPQGTAPRCEGDRIPLMFDDDQPAVRGKIDGISAQIGIDVGNGGIPIVLWRWAEAHKVADRFRNGKEGSGSGVGGNNVTYRTPHHDIVIGHSALRDVDVNYATSTAGYFSSRADSANLGRALLQKYVVRFDYAHGEMCVTPSELAKP